MHDDQPSSGYLFAACCTLEAAYEHEDLEKAKAMLDRYGLTFETAIAELERRGVIGLAERVPSADEGWWLYEYQKAMTNVRGLITRGQSESATRLIDELTARWQQGCQMMGDSVA